MTKEEAINWFISKLIVNDRFGLHGLADDAAKVALAALREQVEAEKPLTADELQKMPQKEWLWIKSASGAAYYQTQYDYTCGEAFCCGYPGIGHAFDYCDYGDSWLAYRRKPEEKTE